MLGARISRVGGLKRVGVRNYSSPINIGSGLIEIREYIIKPESLQSFLAISQNYAYLRKQLLPFLGMFTCETGGVLNRVIHFYYYDESKLILNSFVYQFVVKY
eukprot:TRINITY_DN5279_c0_g1_i8.p2 TRINITY_DN5279_c0_g1~~TRINITY_DN5279_c0_g1_i8.p2  ORF type:complete len:103 (+),score=3.81 TRINITY_DN5279_c0_g1_i8:78-386(+)